MKGVRLTRIGGPTLLIEVGGWRLLTDPTFDAPGRRYDFGWGNSSRKITGPALGVDDVGPVDVALVTHDHHGDNLDDAGRTVVAAAGAVITTVPGARRLADSAARTVGLAPWSSTTLDAPGRPTITVTATPCRHGPPLTRLLVGEVVGFALSWPGQEHGVLWISGDTVLHRGVRSVARRLVVDTAVVHLGKVQFPLTGPARYTMTARDAVRLCRELRPRTVVPVHYDGWSHFREDRTRAETEFARAPRPWPDRVRWLEDGVPTDLATPT